MSRFNYMVDAPPSAIDRLRRVQIAEALRLPLTALVMSLCVVAAWWGLERHWLASAEHEVDVASQRLADSQAAFRQTKLERADVTKLLAFDERLRRIRLSGDALAGRLATIANHVPQRTWLTSIAHTGDGLELDGQADGLVPLSNAVAALMSGSNAPRLVRAAKNEKKNGVISFTVVLPDASP